MVEIHPKAKKAMRIHLDGALSEVIIAEGFLTSTVEFNNRAFKFSTAIRKDAEVWLQESDGISIISDAINSAVSDITDSFEGRTKLGGPLEDVISKEKVSELGNSIISFVESLPRSYAFMFPLPRFEVGAEVSETQFSPSVSLVSAPLVGKGGLLGKALNSKLVLNLKVETMGYANYQLGTSATRHALSTLKRFCYLGVITNEFKRGSRPFSLAGMFSPSYKHQAFGVEDLTEGRPVLAGARLPLAVSVEIEKIIPNTKPDDGAVYGQRLASNSQFAKFLEPNYGDDIAVAQLQTATDWAFDGEAADDDRMSLVQICVALESLLGEDLDAKESITLTLADRCAFLVGRNARERKVIRDKFKKLYQARSKIVHGRTAYLREEDLANAAWGKIVINACLLHELRNIE